MHYVTFFLSPFITQSVHYKTISTTYAVEHKILHITIQTHFVHMRKNSDALA